MSKLGDPPVPIEISYEMLPRKVTITTDGTEIANEVRSLNVEMTPQGAKITIWRQKFTDGRVWDTTDEYLVDTLTITAGGKLA